MYKNTKILIIIFAVFVSIWPCSAKAEVFSYKQYAELLKRYVDGGGVVNYKAIKANRAILDSFTSSLAELDAGVYKTWSEHKKIAFWINAYNSLTLKAIVDNYPIQSTFWGRRLYPENSIRQIKDVWKKLTFSVMGEGITLDGIEHNKLRVAFNEPRIHMALVCAAKSCPSLRNEPYYGDKLDSQLEQQSTVFHQSKKRFRIDKHSKIVFMSKIFEWFGGDFKKTYSVKGSFNGHNATERAALNFISLHINKGDASYLKNGSYSLKYLEYDWSLNE